MSDMENRGVSPTLSLAMDLIARPSVTPDDAGCQALIAQRLEPLGFAIEHLPFGKVTNVWARRGTAQPLVVLAGHTDVVPPGPLDQWVSPPFEPTLRDGFLCGRGAADMKGGLAAMVTAVESFISAHPNHQGSLGFLITSDEEGVAIDGTQRVMAYLQQQGVEISACLLGEPSSEQRIGDCIKNGRRGSLNGSLIVRGKQGHVAYPQWAINPIHQFSPALTDLLATTWDSGNADFPPTTFQIADIRAGNGVVNVIPGELTALFNFRFSTAVTAEQLQQRFESLLKHHGLNYQVTWHLSGNPFFTPHGVLLNAAQKAIQEILGYPTHFSTAGGTSDGRFIAPTGAQVIELGPLNNTIHQINEQVTISDLEYLHRIYRAILERLLSAQPIGVLDHERNPNTSCIS